MKKILGIALILALYMPVDAISATPGQVVKFQSDLRDLNRIKPLQNPRHELASDVIGASLVDSENKVIGEVGDVLVDSDGVVKSIFTDLDRLHLGAGVYLDYRDLSVKNVSSGYKIGMNSQDVENTYPELLANIESASGGQNVGSVQSLMKMDVYSQDGVHLGRISEVLFDQSKTYLRGVYALISHKVIRNEGIAIPFSAVTFSQKSGADIITLDNDYVDAVLEYLD